MKEFRPSSDSHDSDKSAVRWISTMRAKTSDEGLTRPESRRGLALDRTSGALDPF